MPYDGSALRSCTAAFTGVGQEAALTGRTFILLASLDGTTFTQIGRVAGPQNRGVHAGARPGWLYHYKAQALESDGRLWGESPVTLGAAGPNLLRHPDAEELPLGEVGVEGAPALPFTFTPPKAFAVVEGRRPYAAGTRVLHWDPAEAEAAQAIFSGELVPLSPERTYLQGGWVRGSGNAWLGRWFHDAARAQMTQFCYVLMSVSDTPEWTFGAQLLEVDADGSALRRVGGEPRGMMLEAWKFPQAAAYLAPFTFGYGAGDLGDHWVVEAARAPAGTPVTP